MEEEENTYQTKVYNDIQQIILSNTVETRVERLVVKKLGQLIIIG